ncbi:hypothetical protein PtA15_10A314 [Puccinia triticina]|uniref:Uncharacterized protein n=1 Tax=Puccinia triticina TaxID=208348 RepID=A0ABY7CVE7_9BASI|nr:uncharacterized protein PtA15_10A314 [Puccinia triticina]WAQ88893.1 hypothetical protein PtA15_10A314 [Puccinia triticina]
MSYLSNGHTRHYQYLLWCLSLIETQFKTNLFASLNSQKLPIVITVSNRSTRSSAPPGVINNPGPADPAGSQANNGVGNLFDWLFHPTGATARNSTRAATAPALGALIQLRNSAASSTGSNGNLVLRASSVVQRLIDDVRSRPSPGASSAAMERQLVGDNPHMGPDNLNQERPRSESVASIDIITIGEGSQAPIRMASLGAIGQDRSCLSASVIRCMEAGIYMCPSEAHIITQLAKSLTCSFHQLHLQSQSSALFNYEMKLFTSAATIVVLFLLQLAFAYAATSGCVVLGCACQDPASGC